MDIAEKIHAGEHSEAIAPPINPDQDQIDHAALGGHSVEDLPEHYYRSIRFIASFVVSLSFPARSKALTTHIND